jgi:peptidoglycan/xylan/chitin deacetylase (PgdA/CDA1 family)
MDRIVATLAYHKIGPPSYEAWETWYYVPTATFAAQMRWLRIHGWSVIDLSTFLRGLDSPESLPRRAAMITFDDAYRSVLTEAAPVLRELLYPATVFVPTGFVGSASTFDANTREPVEHICSWTDLREIAAHGISVQSHGVSHRTFSQLHEAEIVSELVDSKATIEREVAAPITAIAYPYSDAGLDPQATARAAKTAGYQAAFLFTGGAAVFPAQDRFQITRVPMWPDTDLVSELGQG